MTQLRYLAPDVSIEPLYNRWYVWWYLLSPMTAPLFVKRLHTKIMESFVEAPDIHVAALLSPELAGGPFINEPASQVGAVRALLEQTRRDAAEHFAYVAAIESLEESLAEHRPGHSLESLYEVVPEALKGYVELVYDLNHNPSIRFIEGLLYESRYHREDLHSLALRRVDSDRRRYAFSTPRLDDSETLRLELPFRSSAIDLLASMRWAPRAIDEIVECFKLSEVQQQQFLSFTTEEKPPQAAPLAPSERLRVRYYGHACVLFETHELSVLTDPVISYLSDGEPERFGFFDLPERIDYVLITHGHADHLMLEYLLQLRHRIGTVIVPRSNGGSLADPNLRLLLRANGFKNVVELDELEKMEISGGAIRALPFLGEHCDLQIRAKAAHLVELGGASFLMAADSNALEPVLYDRLAAIIGAIDHLFIGMECEGAPMSWMYGPLFTTAPRRKVDQSRRLNGCNFERAAAIVDRLQPKRVTIYAMGREPWLGHVMLLDYNEEAPQLREARKLMAYCHERGISADMPYGSAEVSLLKD